MAEAITSPGAELPPPPPPAGPTGAPEAVRRRVLVGQLTPAWRAMVVATWIAVFVAYLSVWKASVEIGLATWWLGPRSDPQPVFVQLVPFYVIALFVVMASYNVRRLPAIGVVGALVLAAIAVPDISRSAGLAVVEFAIAGAVLVVSVASATGTYRTARAEVTDDPVGTAADAHDR